MVLVNSVFGGVVVKKALYERIRRIRRYVLAGGSGSLGVCSDVLTMLSLHFSLSACG